MIRNRERMAQIVDFAGMAYGRCKPTDHDLAIDFNREVFVFVELKYHGYGLTVGQRIHGMALVDAIEAGGREAYFILATHGADINEDIIAAKTLPVMVYTKGKWEMSTDSDLNQTIEDIHNKWQEKKTSKKVSQTPPYKGVETT